MRLIKRRERDCYEGRYNAEMIILEVNLEKSVFVMKTWFILHSILSYEDCLLLRQ